MVFLSLSNPQSLNRYAYVNNNPVRYTDPNGHSVSECGAEGSECGGTLAHEVQLGNSADYAWPSGLVASAEQQVHHNTAVDYAVFAGGSTAILAAPEIVGGVATLLGTGTTGATAEAVATAACANGDCTNEVAAAASSAMSAGESLASEIESISIGSNTVYRYADENGVTRYIGITNNFIRRAGEHLRTRGWEIKRIPGLSQLSRYDARAVEQVLIEHFGLSRDGGTLLNKINSISSQNSIYQEAIQRGREILDLIGFPN